MQRFFLTLIFCFFATVVQAATYYVDGASLGGACSDSNNGTALTTPYCTLSRGAAVAVAGDTVNVRTATYNSGSTFFSPTNSGTAAAPIVFQRYLSETPTLTRTAVDDVQGVFNTNGRNYITVRGFTFGTSHAFSSYTGTNIILEDSTFNGGVHACTTGNIGVVLLGGVGPITVRNNSIQGLRWSGTGGGCFQPNASAVKISHISNVTIENNLIFDTPTGVFCKRVCNNVTIRRNYFNRIDTFDGTSSGAISAGVGSDAACSGDSCRTAQWYVYENVIYDDNGTAWGFGHELPSGSSPVYDIEVYNNTFYGSTNCLQLKGGGPTSGGKFYNNVCAVINTGFQIATNISQSATPLAASTLSDFSMFYQTDTVGSGRFRTSNSNNLTLTQWQTTYTPNKDTGSIVDDAELVGTITGTNPAVTVFKLGGVSPGLNFGHVGGVVGGAAQNIGAWPGSGQTTTVGLLSGNQFPSCSLTGPTNGQDITVSPVSFSADASDDGSITSVEFFRDGTSNNSDTTSPYTGSWTVTSANNGTHTAFARCTDNTSQITDSSTVNFTISITAGDTTNPTAALSSPADGGTISNTISIDATCTDNVACAGVTFRKTSVAICPEVTAPTTPGGSTYRCTYDTTTVANGSYSFDAVSRDTSNNTATSAARTYTVSNAATVRFIIITVP